MLDPKTTLEATLSQKQEMIREYQTTAEKLDNPDISKMYSHFADAETTQALKIKDMLKQL